LYRKIAISILILVAGIVLLFGDQLKHERVRSTNEFLSNLIIESESLLDSVDKKKSYLQGHDNWSYFEWDNGISFWTTNEWMPDSSAFNVTDPDLFQHKSGWDLIIPVDGGKGLLTRKLTRKESGQFDYQNDIPPLKNLQFEILNKETEYSLQEGRAYLNFFGKSNHKKNAGKKHLWVFGLLMLAAVISFNFWRLGSLITVGVTMAARILSLKGMAYNGLDQISVFDPMIFASSELLPSLGDLMLHVVTGLVIVLALVSVLDKLSFKSRPIAWIILSISVLCALFGADLIRSLIVNMVLNSNISFDITHLSSINIYTILSATLMATVFWLWYVVISGLLKTILSQPIKTSHAFLIFLGGVIAFFAFQMADADRSLSGLVPSILFTFASLALLFWAHFKSKRQVGLYKYVTFILLFSFFYSTTLNVYQKHREEEYLNLYASKLISNKDVQAEFLFKEMENNLAQRFLQPEDFEAFSNKKEYFEKRLRRLYFSGYLDKYNLLVLSFDSIGNNINSSTLYNVEDLNEIYNYKSFPTLSNHFYQVKSDRIFNGYLAKFENCDLNGHYGSVFILLEPKFIQSSYEYPQLVTKKKDSKIFDLDDYSYSLYSNGLLLNQKGTYPYNLHYDSTHFQTSNTLFDRNSFRHFVSHQEGAIVVLSHPNNRFKSSISTFSFSFVFFILLFACFGLLWVLSIFVQQFFIKQWSSTKRFKDFKFNRQQQLAKLGIEQVYLSTRIRLSMVSLVFAGLLVSIYVTIQFIQINHQIRSENELMYKIREVANQLQNEVNFSKKLRNPESRQLIVNEIGDVHKIDANLYDSSGILLASSIEDIYRQGLSAPRMNPGALEVFRSQRTSQLVHSERIRNLTFTSAYLPLVNDKRSVIAYLNLPYYSRQNELSNEISSYTVTFVNLYLFLILIAIALAYIVSQRISKPLQIIREKMSQTGLQTNELIEWKQNDEIGRLVKQYNKMVMQLGDSAQKLSESEREGAWKEMARQVAHEIKNPLTPMKLNVQHLQRAWSDNSDRLEDTFNRVTGVLIEQIDSLSKLATEFSSFAKMPVNNFENCNLGNSLLSTITLFEKSENVDFLYNDELPRIIVFADREQLGRVFNNVIKNAIQSIPENRKGLIKIDVQVIDQTVRVDIIDNGKGIKKEDMSHVFVPNFSTKNSGMGLGLAITRKMLEAADGKIWFTSEINKGSTFSLQWPIVTN